MNEGLDAALVLETEGGKPSKQYRTSPYTVRQYCALPYAQRVAVDAACDQRAGIERTAYADETSVQPYIVGRATQKVPPTTSQSPPAMTTAYVHPAPSPALHTLNSPELIDHDAAHPDSLATYAAAAPRNVADLLDVVSRYVTLTERVDETEWTHWGPSPFLRGDTHSFAVNIAEGLYKCFTSLKAGDVVDFIMFMEELSATDAVAWLKVNFPNHYDTPAASAEIVGPACDYPGRAFLPPAEDQEAAHGDLAFTPAGLPEGVPLAALASAVDQAAAPAVEHGTPVAHTGTVYETTNYDLFHLLPKNRPVKQAHVRKMMAIISERNLLRSQPLQVTPDMGLVDGQHRLAAARELGLPVYYKIEEQLSAADITALNMARKNWEATDYLHMYTVEGKPAYVAFTAFRERHPRISFSNAKILLSGGTGGSKSNEFRLGLWEGASAAEVVIAEQIAELVESITDEVPSFKQSFHTGFVGALYHCATKVDRFDATEMMRSIRKQPLSLVPCASHKQWLQMLGTIYNYGKREGDRLRFE